MICQRNLFTTSGDHHRKPQLSTMQRSIAPECSQAQWIHSIYGLENKVEEGMVGSGGVDHIGRRAVEIEERSAGGWGAISRRCQRSGMGRGPRGSMGVTLADFHSSGGK